MSLEELLEECDALYDDGDYERLIVKCDDVLEKHPDICYLRNNLAMGYYELGEYEKSLNECGEGLKIRDFGWLCENKLKALIKLDRTDEAIEFEKSISHEYINLIRNQ